MAAVYDNPTPAPPSGMSRRGALAKRVDRTVHPRGIRVIGRPIGSKAADPAFCAYSAHSVSELNQFGDLIGRPVNCALVFNDAAPGWEGWTMPWYIIHGNPEYNWAKWKNAVQGRQLILTQEMFPSSIKDTNWLLAGSLGQYNSYAVALAKNLVAAGLGSSYLRLAHEMNGNWYYWSVPGDSLGQAQWREYWRQIVSAMRSVPGADFKFVWNVNYRVRNLSYDSFYPGDAYVDDVGIDAYDAATRINGSDRFSSLNEQQGGISDVIAFAKSHRKTVSFPEWGLWPSANYGGGDDPGYIDGIAKIIRTQNVSFTSYWYAHQDTMQLLQNSSASLARMRYHFGSDGYSLAHRSS